MVDILVNGQVDLCLTSPDPQLPEVEWTPLWSERLVLVGVTGDPKFPAPARDYRREAIRATDGPNVDRLNDAGVEAIATAIHGTTAALLHLADIIARTNTTV